MATVLPHEVPRREPNEDFVFESVPSAPLTQELCTSWTPADCIMMSLSTSSKPEQPCHQESTSGVTIDIIIITTCSLDAPWGSCSLCLGAAVPATWCCDFNKDSAPKQSRAVT